METTPTTPDQKRAKALHVLEFFIDAIGGTASTVFNILAGSMFMFFLVETMGIKGEALIISLVSFAFFISLAAELIDTIRDGWGARRKTKEELADEAAAYEANYTPSRIDHNLDMLGQYITVLFAVAWAFIVGFVTAAVLERNGLSITLKSVPAGEWPFVTFMAVLGTSLYLISTYLPRRRRATPPAVATEPVNGEAGRKMNPVIVIAAGVFLAGLFITLFFGFLIVQNAMVG